MDAHKAIASGALNKAFPGKKFRFMFSEPGYAGLIWLDPSPKPSKEEFELALSSFTVEKISITEKVDKLLTVLVNKGTVTLEEVLAENVGPKGKPEK